MKKSYRKTLRRGMAVRLPFPIVCAYLAEQAYESKSGEAILPAARPAALRRALLADFRCMVHSILDMLQDYHEWLVKEGETDWTMESLYQDLVGIPGVSLRDLLPYVEQDDISYMCRTYGIPSSKP